MSIAFAKTIVGSGFGLKVGFKGNPSGQDYLAQVEGQLKEMRASKPPVPLETHELEGLDIGFADARRQLGITVKPRAVDRHPWGLQAEFDPAQGIYTANLFRGKFPKGPIENEPNDDDPSAPKNNRLSQLLQFGDDYVTTMLAFVIGAGQFAAPEKNQEFIAALLEETKAEGSQWQKMDDDGEEGSLIFEYTGSGEFEGSITVYTEGIFKCWVQLITQNGTHDFLPETLKKFMNAYGASILSGSGQ